MSVSTDEQARINRLEQRVDRLETELQAKDQRIKELETVRDENQELQDQVEEQKDRISELENTTEQLHTMVDQQADRIDELEADLQAYREQNEKDKAAVKRRVTDLEQPKDENRGDGNREDRATGTNGENRGGTPLHQLVSLPDQVAQTELTANQDRARFIATDILDYATSVPAGYAVTSSDIRTVLVAKEDGTPHTETVSRVMNFLDRFGQDAVKTVKRRGKRRVVFTEPAANRLHTANARDHEDVTGVVMGKATG